MSWCLPESYFCSLEDAIEDSTFSTAASYCELLNEQKAHGYDDWYLPTASQLVAIWNYGVLTFDGFNDQTRNINSLNDSIENTNDFVMFKDIWYWSSSSHNLHNAYYISMYNGYVYNISNKLNYFVRCVRDP